MSAAKHTPGPWIEHGDFKEIHPVGDEDGLIVIADIDPEDSMPSQERIANARLIAAAPELLRAAHLALALIRDTWIEEHGNEQVGNAWGALESAILKAGEQP